MTRANVASAHKPFAALVLAAAAALTLAAPVCAAPTTALGGHDVGALMSAAEERFDLSTLDAVVLLDELTVTIEENGTMRRTTHTVVWFSTELGLDTYADLRVPYNTATSELEVHALRTWREGVWWPHDTELSPTAIVETTPYAVQSADDYTSMREVMLLHDGVELPCIVETAYTITERRNPDLGSDELWVVPNPDPTVLKSLSVTIPGGTAFSTTDVPGAPEPTISRSPQHGVTYRWVAELVDRLPRPLTGEAMAHEPYVVWSTWESWDAMGSALVSSIDEAAILTDALRDSVAAVMDGHPLRLSRAEAIARFLRETTRAVNYDESFWRFNPRRASRTWETAYGHRLDRATLAAALLREAGIEVMPVFASPGRAPIDTEVPAFSWFGRIELCVGDGVAALDPASGRLHPRMERKTGKTIWRPDTGPVGLPSPDVASVYELTLSLEPGDEGWAGAATLRSTGVLSAHASARGLGGETETFFDRVASSVLGAGASDIGLESFEAAEVTAGFALSMDAPELDDAGRTGFVIGDPVGGTLSLLPGDVHTYVADRDSPVLLPGPLSQTVTLRLNPGDAEIVRLPEPTSLTNSLGEFSLTMEERDDGTLVVTRSLAIGEGSGVEGGENETYNGLLIEAQDWPLLRALLLEESDPRHRTLLVK